MSTQVDTTVADENLDKPMDTKESIKDGQDIDDVEAKLRSSVKSGENEVNTEDKKSPSPSIKSGQGEAKIEDTNNLPKVSIKDNEGEEGIDDANMAPKSSIKSVKGEENAEEKKPPSIKSGQGVESVEDSSKSSKPDIESGQGEEAEAKKTPKSSLVDEIPVPKEKGPSADSENIPANKVEEVFDLPATQEVKQPSTDSQNVPAKEVGEAVNLPISQEMKTPSTDSEEIPLKKVQEVVNLPATQEVNKPREQPKIPEGRRRVSFREETNPSSWKPQGGFKSNKDVRLPSVRDDPTLLRSTTGTTSTSLTRPVDSSQPQPWVFAVFGLFFLTIVMRFFMSTFKFICVAVYAGVVSLLALRFYGHGPLVGRRRTRR